MTKVSNEPLISVIVPVYKVEKYLDKCVNSILNQSYKNIEVILVDDGSPDKCPEMCDNYQKKDKRIKVIHKQNGGLSDARNEGIKLAKGKFITFVDSDDYIHKELISVLYENLHNYQCDISCCELLSFKREEECKNIKVSDQNVIVYDRDEYIKKYMKIGSQTIEYYAPTKLFKKEVLRENQFPIGLTSEDVFGTYKALLKSKKIVKSNLKMYFYRINQSSITGSFSEKDFDLVKIWDLVVEYTKNEAPKYLKYAIINRKRINFTLLYRLAKNLDSKELKNSKRVEELLNELKKDRKLLTKSNIEFKRKVIINLFCLNYFFTAKIIKKVM